MSSANTPGQHPPTWSLDFGPRHTRPPAPQQPTRHLAHVYPHQPMSLSGISLRAFLLGAAFSLGLLSAVLVLALTSSPLWRIPFFLACLSLFHFLEFWSTARRNTPEATVNAFLLTANWPAYPVAHAAAVLECLATCLLFPGRRWAAPPVDKALLAAGLGMVVAGQAVRSVAMLHAGASFNHTVQTKKADSHRLVTTGVYGVLRHPGYFGFFYWGLGTQLVLGNVLCFAGYSYVLHKFFSSRVAVEERKLVEFFGDEYVEMTWMRLRGA
ncbi:hypothetical protein UVI_02024810 [Ustilaginoidea virens]|uniref:Protein-S-isoprenylcysteine O-methyltransferase n=1 Tax=Ustilaginoidea virens TaxID=1159556 RepID=A0A1B5KQZ2_USTVR|nr:hypothetical protein UVI_02024810 [Ustilaginoidea virens]